MRLSDDASRQTFDAVLELAVLGGVDERVDAAVGEHHYHGEVTDKASRTRRQCSRCNCEKISNIKLTVGTSKSKMYIRLIMANYD